jgi:hypothetical protein
MNGTNRIFLNKDFKTGEFWKKGKMLIFLVFGLNDKKEGRYCEELIIASWSILLGWSSSILSSLLSSNRVVDKRLLL